MGNLLIEIAAEVPNSTRGRVGFFLGREPISALDYEAAAQVLRDELTDDRFLRALRKRLAEPPGNELITRRLALLRGIPFRAILTTNFDGLLVGVVPGALPTSASSAPSAPLVGPAVLGWAETRSSGRQAARRSSGRPAGCDRRRAARLPPAPARRSWLPDFPAGGLCHEHRSLSGVLVHGRIPERIAIRSAGSTRLSCGDEPIAYALVNDVPQEQVVFLREHEGICVLTYGTHGGRDFAGFDRWLEALHEAASPVRRLGRVLAGKRLLWLDPNPANNMDGMRFLREAAGTHGCTIATVSTWAER